MEKPNKITSYKDLNVWQMSHELTLILYKLTNTFPSDEKFGLISQIRRASVSISLNIVEGKNRNTTKEFINFLYMSRGSCKELDYLIFLSNELTFISNDDYKICENKIIQIGKMLNSLISSLKRKL